ncbi:MAG: hypothetical protein UV01_C0004G0147 [Parcubacteria group bacterium GW2011_GWA2_42_14]|nr:MAG: hypothetical protein UV01_C0004G0147 [Parcubacteria group bacterium GW2011_GWA2_42_14]
MKIFTQNSAAESPQHLYDGLLMCSRYAFGPNRLHYCGPDANREIFSYIKERAGDPGLEILLKAFKTMYPYLRLIADANSIRDPFDNRVVEAYWLGNELLETVEKKKFWRHLLEEQEIKKKIGNKSFEVVANKIKKGGVPNHSFHVLDIWKRTGHLEREHTLESMDSCRISWGKITARNGPFLMVKHEPLLYRDGKLILGSPQTTKIAISLESDRDIEELKTGDLVSIHWGVICEKITPRQAGMLKKYTLRHLELANQTI